MPMGMPMMMMGGNFGGGSPQMMMLPNGQVISLPMGAQPGMMPQMATSQGPQSSQGTNSQGGSGQQVFMIPMGQQPNQSGSQQQNSSASTSSTQPNMQALQSMMGSIPMMMQGAGGPQGSSGIQGVMLPQMMMGAQGNQGQISMINPGQSNAPGPSQIPGMNVSAFSAGNNNGMGFMMPNMANQSIGQKPP